MTILLDTPIPALRSTSAPPPAGAETGIAPSAPTGRPAYDPLRLADALGGRGEVFPMHAEGGALRDALLDDGDTVLLQKAGAVSEGELAAVRIDGVAGRLLRRIYRQADRLRLQPEDRRLPALVVEPSAVTVEGKVLAVLRRGA